MPKPLLLSTWSFGKAGHAIAWPMLDRDGALDAALAAAAVAEQDLANHTVGRGGYADAAGMVCLDAAVMLSPRRNGAVASLSGFASASAIARAVMDHSPHRLLVGAGAQHFAIEQGFTPQRQLTRDSHAAYADWSRAGEPALIMANMEEAKSRVTGESLEPATHDTIGVIALDARGELVAVTSTSGLAYKKPGRVGDTPIIGAGIYCDPAAGAAVLTGRGELVLGTCTAFLAVEQLRLGKSPADAAAYAIQRLCDAYDLGDDDQVGIIVCTPAGDWSAAAVKAGFNVSVRDASRDEIAAV